MGLGNLHRVRDLTVLQSWRTAPWGLGVRREGCNITSGLAHGVRHVSLLMLHDLPGHVDELAVGCGRLIEVAPVELWTGISGHLLAALKL